MEGFVSDFHSSGRGFLGNPGGSGRIPVDVAELV